MEFVPSSIRGTPGAWLVAIGCVLAALLCGLAVFTVPLGMTEAKALAALQGLNTPGAPLGAGLAPARADGLAAVSLLLAHGLSWLIEPALISLRLPDAIAGLLICVLVGTRLAAVVARPLAVCLLVAIPLLWPAVVAEPGTVLNMAAGLGLYLALAGGARRWQARAAALAGLAVLIGNGAGLLAAPIIGGVWLQRGLVEGDWRLAGQHRVTALAALALAGLTLTGQLAVPSLGGLEHVLSQAASPGFLGEILIPGRWSALVFGTALAVWALAVTALDARGDGGRCVLVVFLAGLVLAGADLHAPAAPWTVVPLFAVGLAGAMARPGLAGRAMCGLVVLGLAAISGLVAVALVQDPRVDWAGLGPGRWGLPLAGGLLALGLVWALFDIVNRVAVLMCFTGLAIAAAALVLVSQPGMIWHQRSDDAALGQDIEPWRSRPIAVLAPVPADYWRVALGRPLYRADSLAALCRWAADHRAASSPPVVLLSPGQAAPLAASLPGWHPVLQSPGTPQRSVIVAELPTTGCRAPGMARHIDSGRTSTDAVLVHSARSP